MANIAFTGSHNSTFAVEHKGKILLVLEVERFLGYKNSGLTQYKVPRYPFFVLEHVLDYIKSYTGFSKFENCISIGDTRVNVNGVPYDINCLIEANNYITTKHHLSHAGGSFYQSPYEEALIISFDGGGNDGTFNVYHGERSRGLEQVFNFNLDFGFPYMIIGHYLDDIKLQALQEGHLVYPGKVMGLVSYGTVNMKWLPMFEKFVWACNMQGHYNHTPIVQLLQDATGIPFLNNTQRLSGQIAYDVAATLQCAWENVFLNIVSTKVNIDIYKHLPICLTGGCALNILLNTRIKKELDKRVFVGPVPNDSGLAVGMLLNHIKPTEPADVTYAGLPLLDINMLPEYINTSNYYVNSTDVYTVVKEIAEGKIIGIARGQSEVGPRGLGNRSIICNPMIKDMKDILNKKVKNREWYRPFAPIVRLQDISKYFEWEDESRWMTFAPVVREEWREKLPAITHIDNTARVQTVTREQNPYIYDLLTEMEVQTGVGVLLNTSFNVNGKPILTTVKDVFNILKNTQLDGAVIEKHFITKNRVTNEYYCLELVKKFNA